MTATLTTNTISIYSQKTTQKRWPFWILAVETLIAIIALVVFLECLFAVAGIGEQEYLRIDQVLGFAPMEGKHVTWRQEGFSRLTFNSQGMQDREHSLVKPAGTYRIAIIGDSFTEALQVDRSQNFCSLLENSLNETGNASKKRSTTYEVLNFGCAANNLGQMYLKLKDKALQYHPDLVLLMVSVDTTKLLAPLQDGFAFANARPTFTGDIDGEKPDYRVFDLWRLSPEGKRLKNTSWLRQYSHIWGTAGTITGNVYNWYQKITQGKVWGWGEQLATMQPLLTKHVMQAETPASPSQAPLLPQQRGDVSGATARYWPVAQRLIEAMQAECAGHGSQFVIVRLPGRPQTGYENPLETKLLHDQAIATQLPYLDLNPAFEIARAKESEGKLLFYTVHLTPTGHQVVSAELARYLKQKQLLK